MGARTEAESGVRSGRRPGLVSTRRAVLDAARARFADDGYAGTTIRRIAADAGVDPSQVIQFFHSKDELFAAVMAVPVSALARFDTAFEGPDEHLGERVARAYLGAWEHGAESRAPLMAMLRGAVVHEHAAAQLRDFIQSRLSTGARGRGADAVLHAGLVASMLVGITTARQIIGVPELVATDIDDVVAIVAPAIQLILAGPSDAPA